MPKIVGKTANMMYWRTLDNAEDLKSAKEKEFELIRAKGFNWRIKVLDL
jgi:hypothetical protein